MSKFADMPKLFQDMKIPGFDMEAMLSAQRKNFQAIASANQAAVEGIQTVVRRQNEILRQTMQESSELLNQVMASSSPEEKVTKHAELTKSVFDRAIGNAKEITELMTKVNYEALEVISNRVGEGLEELRGIMKSGSTAVAKSARAKGE
ncbi:MAG: TIGR01841 family phasin [Alphaproteobacteria bacterium]